MVDASLLEQAKELGTKGGVEPLFVLPVAVVVSDLTGENESIFGTDGDACILVLTPLRILLFGVERQGRLSKRLRPFQVANFDFDEMTPKFLKAATDEQPDGLGFLCGRRRVSVMNIPGDAKFETMATFAILQSAGFNPEEWSF